MPNFREGQMENRAKTAKIFNCPGLLEQISPICPLMVRKSPISPSLLKITPPVLKVSQKLSKTIFLNKFSTCPPNLKPIPPLISGLNPKFYYVFLTLPDLYL